MLCACWYIGTRVANPVDVITLKLSLHNSFCLAFAEVASLSKKIIESECRLTSVLYQCE